MLGGGRLSINSLYEVLLLVFSSIQYHDIQLFIDFIFEISGK